MLSLNYLYIADPFSLIRVSTRCFPQQCKPRLRKSYLVSTHSSDLPASFLANPPSNADGGNPPRLSDYDVTVLVHTCIMVKDVLCHLGGLTTASGSLDHCHLVTLYGGYNLRTQIFIVYEKTNIGVWSDLKKYVTMVTT